MKNNKKQCIIEERKNLFSRKRKIIINGCDPENIKYYLEKRKTDLGGITLLRIIL